MGSPLLANTYGAGQGPGLWITSMGGYRVYLDGELLAWDNQPGRIRFLPLTLLPGSHALAVAAVHRGATPGVLVQLDELDSSHVTSAAWRFSSSPVDAAWKQSLFSDASWSSAKVTGSSATRPDAKPLQGWATGSKAQWAWSGSPADSAVILRYTFRIASEGFGAATTGGAGGAMVVARTAAEIKTALQSAGAKIILVPEGVYDFRNRRDDANGKYKWCTKSCAASDGNPSNTYTRVTFDGACGSGEAIATQVSRWENWIPITANKTLVGMGRGAKLRGASIYVRGAEGASNAIFRNLAVYDVNPHLIEANDGISSDNTAKLWIDHCSFKWLSDGNDLGGSTGTKEVSVTWSVYDGENHLNCYKYDPYVALLEDIDATYANNYWKNTNGRVPKIVSTTSLSRVHIYHNYYDFNSFFLVGPHGASNALAAEVLWESNYVRDGKGYLTMKGPFGRIQSKNNVFAGTVGTFQNEDASGNRTQTTEPKDAVFAVPYAYRLAGSVADLPAQIPLKAGIGAQWNELPTYEDAAGLAKIGPSLVLGPMSGGAAPLNLTLNATATAGGSNLAKVDFFLGDSLLGSDATAPYTLTASGIKAGTWSMVAVATDASGLKAMSEPVTLAVSGTSAIRKEKGTKRKKARALQYEVQGRKLKMISQ